MAEASPRHGAAVLARVAARGEHAGLRVAQDDLAAAERALQRAQELARAFLASLPHRPVSLLPSPERMSAALDATRTALQALLSTPAICAAMVELKSFNAGYADCAVARSIIASRATTILSNYDARRTALLPLIATYRAKP